MSASISSLSSRSNREMSALVSCALSGISGAICRSHPDGCPVFWVTLSSLTGLCRGMLPKFNQLAWLKNTALPLNSTTIKILVFCQSEFE